MKETFSNWLATITNIALLVFTSSSYDKVKLIGQKVIEYLLED